MGSRCCKSDQEEDEQERETQREERKCLHAPHHQRARVEAACQLQAWWRGTLVRRTLLVAALRAWTIQVWWRALQWRRVQKQQRTLLKTYVVQEQAAVRLQSWVRMCQCYHRYSQMCNTVCVLPALGSCLAFQTHQCSQAQNEGTGIVKQLEFHIEILSI